MSKSRNRLSAQGVRTLTYNEKGNNRHADGGNLYLQLNRNGGKYWQMRYRRPTNKKPNVLSLGTYPPVTLAEARQKRDEAEKLIVQGIDPAEQRNQYRQQVLTQHENTFAVLAQEWLDFRKHENRDDHENERRLNKDILPYIGDKPVHMLTPAILQTEVIKRIIDRSAIESARRIRTIIKMVLEIARRKSLITSNPASDITVPTPTQRNHAAIVNKGEVKRLIKDIWDHGKNPRVNYCTVQALKLSMLLFLRPSELRTLKWVDYKRDESHLEIETVKQQSNRPKKTLIVPLADQAKHIIEELYQKTGTTEYMFFSPTGKEPYLSEATVNMALKRMGYNKQQTAHGFRATARTILDEELGYRTDWIEMQLSHITKDPNGIAYNRSKYLPQRREMMQGWATYIYEIVDNDS